MYPLSETFQWIKQKKSYEKCNDNCFGGFLHSNAGCLARFFDCLFCYFLTLRREELLMYSFAIQQNTRSCKFVIFSATMEAEMNNKISFCFAWLPQYFLNWVYTSCDINNSYRQWLRFKSQRLSLEQYIQNVGIVHFIFLNTVVLFWFCDCFLLLFFSATTCNIF